MAKVKKTRKKQPPKKRNPMARDLASPLYRPRIAKKKSRREEAERGPDLASLLTPDD